MRRTIALAAALLALAACSAKPPAAAPASTSVPLPAATAIIASAPTDEGGAIACRKVDEADMDTDKLMTAGTVDDIAAAASLASDSGIQLGGKLLAEKYDDALAAIGTDGETAATLNLMTASIELSTACIKAGLSTQ